MTFPSTCGFRESSRRTLSVCCLSASPLVRTAAILRQFSGVADEIVCAVDSRVPTAELAELAGVADIVKRCQFDPSTGIERNLAWLHSLCSGHWILRIDSDEVPSAELLTELPELVQASDVLQYVLPCLWLFPDEVHFIDEAPWSEDWHLRLVRNERIALQIPGVLHSNIRSVEPLRFVRAPFYHLTCVVQSRDEREAKASNYEREHPGLETMPGWSANNHYLPERFQQRPSSLVPAADERIIGDVLGAVPRELSLAESTSDTKESLEITSFEEIDRYWAHRAVSRDAYHATWLAVPEMPELIADESQRLFVEVRNDGDELWPFGDQFPAIRLGYRWRSADQFTVIADGLTTMLTADVPPGGTLLQPMMIFSPMEPGDYMIELSVVHVNVRWFPQGPILPIAVRPR